MEDDPLKPTVESETARAEQLALNCSWLISKIDAAHRVLCPGQHGTWQQRAEQVVIAAQKREFNPMPTTRASLEPDMLYIWHVVGARSRLIRLSPCGEGVTSEGITWYFEHHLSGHFYGPIKLNTHATQRLPSKAPHTELPPHASTSVGGDAATSGSERRLPLPLSDALDCVASEVVLRQEDWHALDNAAKVLRKLGK